MASKIPKLGKNYLPFSGVHSRKQIERVHTVEAQVHPWGAACGNKKGYETKEQAQQAADRMHVKTGGEIFDAYKCPYGNHYHFGHRIGTKEYKFKDFGVKKDES